MLIVNLTRTVGAAAAGGAVATVTLNVQRGSATFGAGVIIYTAVHEIQPPTVAETNLITINAIDLNAPAAVETVYALFVSATSSAGVVLLPVPGLNPSLELHRMD